MNIIYTDVLIIGGGLAGLRLGIGAKRRGHNVIILSLVPPKRSHSAAAQGGMQASLANVIKGEGDNEDVHFEDTVRGSDWGADIAPMVRGASLEWADHGLGEVATPLHSMKTLMEAFSWAVRRR